MVEASMAHGVSVSHIVGLGVGDPSGQLGNCDQGIHGLGARGELSGHKCGNLIFDKRW